MPLFQKLQEQFLLGISLVLFAEVVDELNLVAQFHPVRCFVVPVAPEQVVTQHRTFLVGFLVGLQVYEGIDQV